jgi:hypothetical protein
MMSVILRLASVMPAMVVTNAPTAWPPSAAQLLAASAIWLAWRVVSALACTVAVSCSMDAAVSCRLLACSSVRWLKSRLPVAICVVPVAMLSLLWRTVPTTLTRLAFMRARACISCAVSSCPRTSMRELRSPDATVSAICTARWIGWMMLRPISMLSANRITAETATAARITWRAVAAVVSLLA